MRQPIQVLVYLTRRGDRGREFLLLHRVANRDDFWQGVSGGVENDETLAEAANREVQEETGLRVDRLVDVAYTYSFPLADRWRHLYAADVARIQEHVFLAEVPATAEPRIDAREHDALQWCLLDEALSMLLWPKNKTALRRANARLRQPGH